MKKSLLLLFSLLIFVGNAWGADCYLLGPTSEDHFSTISSKEYEIDLTKGEAYQLSYEAMCVPILGFWGGELYAAQYVNGKWEDIHNETPPKKSYKPFGPYNINPAATKIKLYTKTGATGHKYFKNVKVTQKKYFTITSATSHNFGNVVYDGSSTESWTVNYKYSSKSVKVSSKSSAFVVSQGTAGDATCGKTGTGSFTVTFKPTKLGENTGTITVGSATISVSGIGTPPIPTNLNATEEFLQSTLSWSGANNSYYQVYNGSTLLYEGKNNSYPWTGRQWGTSYTFSVKACTAKDTNCSDAASKTFSTKTLLAPAGVSVSNIDYDNAEVTWNAAEGASLYRVYLSSDNGSTYTKYGSDVMATSERKMPISGLTPGKKYYVKVESVLNGKETSRTDSKDFTTTSINVPQNVTCTPDYLSATLSWTEVADIDKYDYYVIYDKDGHQVGTSETNSYQINGLQWGVNYGNYTVKVHAFNTESSASAQCNVTTKSINPPTVTTTAGYDAATINWEVATGATSYVVYLSTDGGTSYTQLTDTAAFTKQLKNLEQGTVYFVKVESKFNRKETTSEQGIEITTKNLEASSSFTLSNASYTSCQGTWAPITNATGYKVVVSNGVELLFNGASTTSGAIVGLQPKNTYTCTVYGMYNNSVSKNGWDSNSVTTLDAKCDVNPLGDAKIERNASWEDKYSKVFDAERNEATISFSYATSTILATGVEFFVVQSKTEDGNFERLSWTSKSHSGSASVKLTRGYRFFRFAYSGNFSANISNITASQAEYFEVDKTPLNFGNLTYGTSASLPVNVNYSTMAGDVDCKNQYFTFTPSTVGGATDCDYGTQQVVVTFNADGNAPIGDHSATLSIGNETITMTASVSLPAPSNLTITNVGYDHATASWDAVTGADDYKLYLDDATSKHSNVVNDTHFDLTDLALGTEYTVRVESKKDNSESASAEPETFTTDDLDAPAFVTAGEPTYTSINLTWGTVTDATGYMIVNNTSKASTIVSGGDTDSYTLTGLNMGTSYSFTVYPMYHTKVSKSKTTSNSVTTLTKNVPVSDCLIFEHAEESDFFMSSGESDFISLDLTSDPRYKTHTGYVTFEIKKNTGYVGSIYDVRLFIDVNGTEQSTYIWNANETSLGYRSSDYISCTVNLPTGVTALKFRGTPFSALFTEWQKYGGNERWIKNIKVYMSADATASPQALNFDPYIGVEQTKSFNLVYANRANAVFIKDNDLFTTEFPTLESCTEGKTYIAVKFKPETLTSPVEGSITIVNGDIEAVALNATVKKLPAPKDFAISETTPTSITLTWGDVNITETGYKVVCKQGETEIETKNLGGDVTTCTFEGLTPNVEYTFTITTMYNTIENGSATITGSTANVPAPQNFEISNIMSARADASWSTVTGATGYRLSWDNGGSEGNGSVDLDADVTNYTLTGLIPGTTYTATVTSLFGGTAYGSVDTEFTTTFVVRTSASGDEPANQQHNIEFISGELAGDGSYKAGAVIRYTTSTTSANIRFVSVNVDGIIYNTPEVEIVINSNVHIESYYVYVGIAEVVDEHGEVIYGTLTDAVKAAEEGAVINLLGDVAQDMVVSKYIKFNGNGHDIDNLYINKDGNVELTGAVTVVKDFGLEVSAARSGQFLENGGQIEVTGKAYVDKTFDASGTSKATTWYSLAVPFPVSVANGMFILANNKETAAHAVSDIDIFQYDGAVRAQTISGRPSDDAWVSVTNGYLQPGVFYLVGLPKGGNTFRFYKAEGEELITISKNVDLYEYPAVNPLHGGWNGIGNSQLYHVGVTFSSTGYAQILDTNNKFITIDLGESSFAVTTPMFIQSADDATATFSFKNTGMLRSASAGSATYNLRIAREGANEFADQMFVSASSEATGTYTIGKDLAKFGTSSEYPQIYTNAYNVNLSVHEAAYNEKNIAEMPLHINVPEAGNYTLSLGKDVLDGTTLYLVKDGVEIHNFNTDSSYTLYLAKGKNTSYSLRIAGSEIGDVPTPAAETEADGAIKVYVKEHTLYIEGLADGETYTVGNMIRSLYSGKSNGNIVRLPLDQQGVYWVKVREKGVKVLNK